MHVSGLPASIRPSYDVLPTVNWVRFSKTREALATDNHGVILLATLLSLTALRADFPTLDLHCTLEPGHASMAVRCSLVCLPADKPTTTATFSLGDQITVPRVAILEPKGLAGPATALAKSTQGHDVTYEITLPRALDTGERLKLEIEYASKASRGFVFLLSAKECLAGGYNVCWFPTVGDSRRTVGMLEFESPTGYVVKASGTELPGTDSNGVRMTRFQMKQPVVPTFAAAAFIVKHVDGAVPMTVYLLKDRPVAKEFAEGSAKVLSVLTNEYGHYPFADFSIIETPSPESVQVWRVFGRLVPGLLCFSGLDERRRRVQSRLFRTRDRPPMVGQSRPVRERKWELHAG